MIVDGLYAPSTKGLIGSGSAPLRFSRRSVVSSAAVTVRAGIQPSANADFFAIITHWCVLGIAGAAQTNTILQIRHESAVGQDLIALLHSEENLTTLRAAISRHDALLLMPFEQLTAEGTFNAGVAANQIELNVMGWLFDRGNIQIA